MQGVFSLANVLSKIIEQHFWLALISSFFIYNQWHRWKIHFSISIRCTHLSPTSDVNSSQELLEQRRAQTWHQVFNSLNIRTLALLSDVSIQLKAAAPKCCLYILAISIYISIYIYISLDNSNLELWWHSCLVSCPPDVEVSQHQVHSWLHKHPIFTSSLARAKNKPPVSYYVTYHRKTPEPSQSTLNVNHSKTTAFFSL